jgi:hypothetical protein
VFTLLVAQLSTHAPLEGVGGVRTPELDVVKLVHRELVAARVVANEIVVAN